MFNTTIQNRMHESHYPCLRQAIDRQIVMFVPVNYSSHPCDILGVLMQEDTDMGDDGKEKDMRADAAPPCGITRDDDCCDRRQYEKDDDSALLPPAGAPRTDDDVLLHATSPPGAPGDDGHHVERDADARNVTRGDDDASTTTGCSSTLLLELSFASGVCFFFERRGRWKHSAAHPVPMSGRRGARARGGLLLVSRDDGGLGTAAS
jgi:hypothetical protein